MNTPESARSSLTLMASPRVFTAVVLCAVSVGCTVGEKMSRIQPGMSQAEVVRILGRYDGFSTQGEYTVLRYTNKLVSGWAYDRADYNVILKDDKVVEYGAGEVRQRQMGNVHTVFIHQF